MTSDGECAVRTLGLTVSQSDSRVRVMPLLRKLAYRQERVPRVTVSQLLGWRFLHKFKPLAGHSVSYI